MANLVALISTAERSSLLSFYLVIKILGLNVINYIYKAIVISPRDLLFLMELLGFLDNYNVLKKQNKELIDKK